MQEPTPTPSTENLQQGKPASSRRSARANRNRPVLVTPTSSVNSALDQETSETQSTGVTGEQEEVQETSSKTTTETVRARRLPGFFSTVGKRGQKQESSQEVNPAEARIARATSGKAKTQTSPQETEKPAGQAPARSAPAPSRSAPTRQQRPASAFKMRYIFGMILYLLIADLLGTFETGYIRANHLDQLLFTLGPLPVYISTLAFLVTLLVILVVLARLDLIPRSLAAMGGQSTAQRRAAQSQNASSSDAAKTPQPTMKQGVKGADDDLYQEYREQQRYQQRRARKR